MSKKTSPVMLAGVLPQSALLAVLLLAASLSPKAAVLVNLDATSLPEGALPTWSNTGTEPGDFIASPVVPSVTTVDSVKGVTFNGTDGVDVVIPAPPAASQFAITPNPDGSTTLVHRVPFTIE